MHLFPVLFLKLLSPSLTESAVTVFLLFSGCPSFRFEVVKKSKAQEQKEGRRSRWVQISKDAVFLARGKDAFCQLASRNPDWAQRQREQMVELPLGLCGQDYIPWNLQKQFSERRELVHILSVPAHSFRGNDAEAVCSPGINGAKRGAVFLVDPGSQEGPWQILHFWEDLLLFGLTHPLPLPVRQTCLPHRAENAPWVFSRKGQYTGLICVSGPHPHALSRLEISAGLRASQWNTS